MTPSQLRSEGVIDLGHVRDTQVLWVRTKAGLRLTHIVLMAERKLDRYGLDRAKELVDILGNEGREDARFETLVADMIGLDARVLREQLRQDGWTLKSPRAYSSQARHRKSRERREHAART